MITSNTIKIKTKRWSYLLSLLAVLVFATGQYRLLCVLLLVCINKNCIKSRPLMVRFKSSYKLLLILLFLAIFTVIPNYLQRGRPQLAYFNKKGHRMCAHKCVSAKRAVSRRTSNECVHINRCYYAYYKLNACWHSVGRTTL